MLDYINGVSRARSIRALLLSTLAFTACFAVWTIFSIIGISIKNQLDLSSTQFGVLVAAPILTGSLTRLVLGVWTDQYGGRIVFTIIMLISSFCTYLLTYITSFNTCLMVALGVGLAGGGFAVGVAYVSVWFSREHQGTALGIFGMGNAGAAVTNFGAPFLLVSFGWNGVVQIYAFCLFLMAVLFYIGTETDPIVMGRKKAGIPPIPFIKQIEPLAEIRVWRFALYYYFVFGAFVALALWLPNYYMNVYHLPIAVAGMLTSLYSLPGSIFRALGGWLSDIVGARMVMYWTFSVSLICLFFLSYPECSFIIQGVSGEVLTFSLKVELLPFVLLTVVLGFFMSLGKAAVYKHIPVYYPHNVGATGGIVGLIGGLGGFSLPIIFGVMNDFTKVWPSCFMLLFAITGVSLLWMHFAIVTLERKGLHL